jgi:predicted amidohydrolase
MRIALCQLPISPDPAVNLERVAEAMATAASQGADLAVFPEATQARFGSDLRAVAEPLDGTFCTGLATLAREAGVALVAGVFEPSAQVSGGKGDVDSGTVPDGRVYNTAVAYGGSGELVAAYRKIHLFDALGERESAVVAPGSEPVVADLAGIRTGFATCYDIRFPELFRALAARGAELIVVPGAWAAGLFKEEHWVTLVRARAIENTVWVAAAGQVPDPLSPPTRAPTGVGRSMLVDPMGTVRADLGLWPQVTVAELDSAMTARVRTVLPSLEHRRADVFGPADPAGAAAPAGSVVSGSGSATERDAAQYR